MIVPRWAFDGVEALDGKIYFAGGHDGVVRNLAERYDPLTNQWENLTPMSEARDGMAAAVLNGKFYAIAGRHLNSVEIYDPSNRTMVFRSTCAQPLYAAVAITINEKILLGGGYNSGAVNQVLEFDPATNQWTEKHQCQRPIWSKTCCFRWKSMGNRRINASKMWLKSIMSRTIHGLLGHLFPKAGQSTAWTAHGKNLCGRGI